MVNYSIRSIPEASKYFQEMTQDGLSELGYETPVLKPLNSGSHVIYEKSHAVRNYLTISSDLRGQRRVKADKTLIKDFLKTLDDPDKPLHYTIKNMLKVKYINDIAHLDGDLTKRYDCIVCCFDGSESLFVIYTQVPRGLYEIRPVRQNMTDAIDDVKRRIGWRDTVHDVPIDFLERFSDSNIFAFFVSICIVFDVNESARDLNNLKSIPLNDEILLNILSATQTNSPISPIVLEVLPVHNPIVGQTYLYETRTGAGRSFRIPVTYWFDKKGGRHNEIRPLVIDFNNPYWKTCTSFGRIEDPHDQEDNYFMSYNLHIFSTGRANKEEQAFYLETDWSPCERRRQSISANADISQPDPNHATATNANSSGPPNPYAPAGNARHLRAHSYALPGNARPSGPNPYVLPGSARPPGPNPSNAGFANPSNAYALPGSARPSGPNPYALPGIARPPGPNSSNTGIADPSNPYASPGNDRPSVPHPLNAGIAGTTNPYTLPGNNARPPGPNSPNAGIADPSNPYAFPGNDRPPGPNPLNAGIAGTSNPYALPGNARPGQNPPNAGTINALAAEFNPWAATNGGYRQVYPRRRFLNKYYQYNPNSNNSVYCGTWIPDSKEDYYEEGDKIANIGQNPQYLVEEFIWHANGISKTLNRVEPPSAQLVELPKIYPPSEEPVLGQTSTVCRGILFEVDVDGKWKMQLNPTNHVLGYFGVDTPLGARFYKDNEYIL